MRRVLVACTLLCALFSSSFAAVPSVSAQQGVSCASYDAWEWAQSVFESDPKTYAVLDPDGDGTACGELPHGGFAPAFWTDKIPSDVEEATIIREIDGDTYEMLIGGVSNRVRIYRADTPETQNQKDCGGQQATDFAAYVLGFNDTPNTVYLERDKTTRDKYGRELAYVWFEVGGQPYLLNHILINNGFAADKDYGDRKYDREFQDAAAFAQRHDLGVWSQCGGFGVPLSDSPSNGASSGSGAQAPASTSQEAGDSESGTSQGAAGTSYQEPEQSGGGDEGTYIGGDGCTYTNVSGVQVSCPVQADAPPPGATARCADGTYSFSQNRRGTCSHHGGVAEWLQ